MVKSTCSSWAKSEATTVTGLEEMVEVNSRAKKNSPHEEIKEKIPTMYFYVNLPITDNVDIIGYNI